MEFGKVMENKQKILFLATTASMIEQFNMHNIKILQSLGAEVHVGTNFIKPGTITSDKSNKLVKKLKDLNVRVHQIDFSRGIGTPRINRIALKQVCNIVENYKITGIHAHSPLGGIIGRRAAHRMHKKIIYTAHGLQFFKGGPIKDWLLFFPVEWFYAHWTDALITINTDDYRISRFLPAKTKYYIPGVGINIKRVKKIPIENRFLLREKFRKQNKLSANDYLIISVGELSKRKNHSTVIKAIHKLNDPTIHYMIAGIGIEKESLSALIKHYNLKNNVKLLGYVDDLDSLYFGSDLNIFLSKREGLGIAGIDGIAHGVYTIGNARTGMKDYISTPDLGLLLKSPTNINDLAKTIKTVKNQQLHAKRSSKIDKFDHTNIDKIMKEIYIKEFFS